MELLKTVLRSLSVSRNVALRCERSNQINRFLLVFVYTWSAGVRDDKRASTQVKLFIKLTGQSFTKLRTVFAI